MCYLKHFSWRWEWRKFESHRNHPQWYREKYLSSQQKLACCAPKSGTCIKLDFLNLIYQQPYPLQFSVATLPLVNFEIGLLSSCAVMLFKQNSTAHLKQSTGCRFIVKLCTCEAPLAFPENPIHVIAFNLFPKTIKLFVVSFPQNLLSFILNSH